jgi:hypothetical protein
MDDTEGEPNTRVPQEGFGHSLTHRTIEGDRKGLGLELDVKHIRRHTYILHLSIYTRTLYTHRYASSRGICTSLYIIYLYIHLSLYIHMSLPVVVVASCGGESCVLGEHSGIH